MQATMAFDRASSHVHRELRPQAERWRCSPAPLRAQAPKIGDPPEARNMRLVGYNDLQARSAYQPIIHSRAIDTSPMSAITAAPRRYRSRSIRSTARPSSTAPRSSTSPIPSSPNISRIFPAWRAWASRAAGRWCASATASSLPKGDPNTVYLLRTFGGQAHEIWNVADPASPKLSRACRAARTPTRTGGNARPASPTWSPVWKAGASGE